MESNEAGRAPAIGSGCAAKASPSATLPRPAWSGPPLRAGGRRVQWHFRRANRRGWREFGRGRRPRLVAGSL